MANYKQLSKLSPFFSPRRKTAIHVVQLILVVAIMILGVVRLVTREKSTPMTRTDTIALAIGGKSLVVLAYQVLTEHVARLSRFASLKANLILNCLEIVFWAAVAFLGLQGNTQSCSGSRCGLGWAVVVLAIVSSTLASYASMISYLLFRRRKTNNAETAGSSALSLNGSPMVQTQRSV